MEKVGDCELLDQAVTEDDTTFGLFVFYNVYKFIYMYDMHIIFIF